jgi:hypothetical protein
MMARQPQADAVDATMTDPTGVMQAHARGLADPLRLLPLPPGYSVDRPVDTLTGQDGNLSARQNVPGPRPYPEAEAAGAMGVPLSTLLRQGVAGVQTVGRTAAAHPAATAGMTGAAALTAPSEAGGPQDPTAGPQQPGLWREILNAFGAGRPDEQRPLTEDEFRQARRRLQPATESDFIERQLQQTRESQAYTDATPGQQRRMLDAATKRAREQLYPAFQKSMADEANTLSGEHAQYVEGWNQRRREQLSQPFVGRHPNLATAATVAGPVLAGVLTHRGFNNYNRSMADAARSTREAMAGNNFRDAAANASTADRLARRELGTKLAGAGFYSTIPADMRMMGDFVDRYALPPDAPAQQDAERRQGDLGGYLRNFAGNTVSGAVGSAAGAAGALFGKYRTGPAEARTAASYIAGTGGKSPDQIARVLADRAATADRAAARAAEANASLASARPSQPVAEQGSNSMLARLLRFGRSPEIAPPPQRAALPPPSPIHHSNRQNRDGGQFAPGFRNDPTD